MRIIEPASVDEMIQAVTAATEHGLAVRGIGATHSHSRVAATDGVIVNLDAWNGLVNVDPDGRTATVRSGTRIYELGPMLADHGLAIRNQGDIDRQSIAGAISTGTHGTGASLQNLSSSVTGLRLITSDGNEITCSPTVEPDLFQVARHSLGGVGLITEVELALRSAYRLHERLWSEAPEDVFGRIGELTASTRHFEFFWIPQRDRCACKSLAETDAAPSDLAATRNERVGWSHDIISSTRNELHTEMEYSVPADRGPDCFNELREMVRRDFPDLQWPLEYRTVASDDLWISAARDRETVTISAHQDISLDDRPLFEACEAIFRSYDGRPHWGKVHYQSASELAALHPRWAQWWQVRDRHDPTNTFVTTDLASLRP